MNKGVLIIPLDLTQAGKSVGIAGYTGGKLFGGVLDFGGGKPFPHSSGFQRMTNDRKRFFMDRTSGFDFFEIRIFPRVRIHHGLRCCGCGGVVPFRSTPFVGIDLQILYATGF